jgi:hypothetical protein
VPLISDGSNYKVMKGDLLVVQSKRINSNINQFGGFQKIHGLFLIVYKNYKATRTAAT